MAAGKYSFTIEQGTTVDFDIQWTDSGSNKIDLSGYEAAMNIKLTHAGNPVLTATSSMGDDYSLVRTKSGSMFLSVSGSGNCDTPTASGSLGVYFGYANTTSETLTANEYVYDIELTDTVTEKRTRLVEGIVYISKQVTTTNPVL